MLPLVVTCSGGSPSEPRGSVLRRGAWSQGEDELLTHCIEKHGVGKWGRVPQLAGLNRCRKSCRLRWLNYLNPSIKRGRFAEDEEDLIIRLHKLLGNRWSLIAGRIPGRTANDVKNYWNSHFSRKLIAGEKKDGAPRADGLIKPQPQTIPSNWMWTMKPRAKRAKHQQEESETEGRPTCMGDDYRAWAEEDHILFDAGTNHAGSHMEEDLDMMMMELQTRIGVEEDMVGFKDEELIPEGETKMENLLCDIDLWSEYALTLFDECDVRSKELMF